MAPVNAGTTRERRLAAIDALIADLRIRGEDREVRKVSVVRDRIARGAVPLKGAVGRAREMRELEPIA